MSNIISRRNFLRDSARIVGAASGVAFANSVSAREKKILTVSKLEKLNIGVIGLGGQGRFVMERFQANPTVNVVALADCYTDRMDQAEKKLNKKVKKHQDFRKLLERKDIDAVVIASPDHWHCLMSIYACQAGKDVYVEKPLSLCIDEGRQLIQHAHHHKRVVQVGLMQRSGPMYQKAVEIVKSGKLGKISTVKAWNIYNRLEANVERTGKTAPNGLDWDLWTGPRPKRGFQEALLHGGFRWVWDFGGGNITDRGTHTFDTILEAMDAKYPQRVSAVGGKYVFNDKDDQRETPDTLNVLYDFGDWTLHYEAREANHRVQWPSGYGFVFLGSKASLFVDRGGLQMYRERNRKGLTGEELVVGTPGEGKVVQINELFDPHIQNFIDCIGTRKPPVCDVEIGHRSTNISHLGNIAYHTKSTIDWDGENEVCRDNNTAQLLTRREYQPAWSLPKP